MMGKLRRILCLLGWHKTSDNDWGADLQRGVVEYFCVIPGCGKIVKTVSLDDSGKAGEAMDIMKRLGDSDE